jgi:hypothetical protein
LDGSPPPKDVPGDVLTIVKENFEALRAAWDQMYPENPVELENDDA